MGKTDRLNERLVIAYHEAAHAVVAAALGIPPERLDLQPAESKWGMANGHFVPGKYGERAFRERGGVFYERRRESLFKVTCVLYAGPTKERWVTGECVGGGGDFAQIDEVIEKLGLQKTEAARWCKRASRRAGAILWRRSDAVERLANALSDAGELNAGQIKRLLRKPRAKATAAKGKE